MPTSPSRCRGSLLRSSSLGLECCRCCCPSRRGAVGRRVGCCHPYSPPVGQGNEVHSLQEEGQQHHNSGDEQHVGTKATLAARKKITLTHDEHLDREKQQREGIDIEQCIAVAYLQRVGQFEELQQVDDPYSTCGRKKLIEMLAIRLGPVKPFEQLPIEMGDNERQVGREEYYMRRVAHNRKRS